MLLGSDFPPSASGVATLSLVAGVTDEVDLRMVRREPYRAGTFEKSGPNPSAIVRCAITASRSFGYGRFASIYVA